MVVFTSACSSRPTRFIPPNRADPIIEVSKVEVEETADILKRIDNNPSTRNAEQLKLLAMSDAHFVVTNCIRDRCGTAV